MRLRQLLPTSLIVTLGGIAFAGSALADIKMTVKGDKKEHGLFTLSGIYRRQAGDEKFEVPIILPAGLSEKEKAEAIYDKLKDGVLLPSGFKVFPAFENVGSDIKFREVVREVTVKYTGGTQPAFKAIDGQKGKEVKAKGKVVGVQLSGLDLDGNESKFFASLTFTDKLLGPVDAVVDAPFSSLPGDSELDWGKFLFDTISSQLPPIYAGNLVLDSSNGEVVFNFPLLNMDPGGSFFFGSTDRYALGETVFSAVADVPGPIPALGLAVFFGYARRLRKLTRCSKNIQQ
jgi:hypothetical protein